MLAYPWAYPGPPRPSRAARTLPRKSRNHFLGQLTFGEERGQGQCLVFESMLEYNTALQLIYRPGVVDVIDQQGPVVFAKASGKRGTHYLDYVAVERAGRRTGVVVKPAYHAMRPAFRLEVARIAAAATPSVVDRVVIVTERSIDRQRLARYSQFHAARFAQPEYDAALEQVVDRGVDPVSIRDLLLRTGVGPAGFHAALRSIRYGRLQTIEPGLVKMSSIVHSTGLR
ncbi:hypothetical protein [Solirhodobacter olei]|uniref:hypothetical protein n=1 Tax=Solirhodobacter olei TaxID=2493082 RepID=UPI000FDC599C|nr:hypothetical protein [Solirhodobacter olei]